MLRLVVILALVTNIYAVDVCDRSNSEDISDFLNNTNSKNVINARGVKYARNQYYTDEISGAVRGCDICLNTKKVCVRKCCALGYGYHTENRECVKVNEEFHAPVWDNYRLVKGKDAAETFRFVIGRQDCGSDARVRIGQLTNHIHLKEDGSLYMEVPGKIPPFNIFPADRYCVDTFVFQNKSGALTARLDALVCYAVDQKEEHYIQTITCMIISCVFILATCAVYWFLPELRNLHGRVLLAYLVCLFVGFVFLATMQILIVLNSNTANLCLGFTFIIYYSLLSAFFWLNVMCFDIWWTFSGNRGLALGKLSKRGRFYAYATYAFGIPTMLTILLAALEFSGLPAHAMLPMISKQGCFLSGTSKLVYLYGPIVILCCANLTFFVLTALKITQIKQQTSVLKSGESSTHDQHRNDKQRLYLYIKLFIVMGINWILEVASACYPQAEYIWRVTDAYNVLIGVPIFFIFVFKRKIFHLLKKRMKERFQRRKSGVGDVRKLSEMHRKRLNKYGPRVSIETLRSTIYITDSDGSTKDEKTSKL